MLYWNLFIRHNNLHRAAVSMFMSRSALVFEMIARLSQRIWMTTPRGRVDQELKLLTTHFLGVVIQSSWLNLATVACKFIYIFLVLQQYVYYALSYNFKVHPVNRFIVIYCKLHIFRPLYFLYMEKYTFLRLLNICSVVLENSVSFQRNTHC